MSIYEKCAETHNPIDNESFSFHFVLKKFYDLADPIPGPLAHWSDLLATAPPLTGATCLDYCNSRILRWILLVPAQRMLIIITSSLPKFNQNPSFLLGALLIPVIAKTVKFHKKWVCCAISQSNLPTQQLSAVDKLCKGVVAIGKIKKTTRKV